MLLALLLLINTLSKQKKWKKLYKLFRFIMESTVFEKHKHFSGEFENYSKLYLLRIAKQKKILLLYQFVGTVKIEIKIIKNNKLLCAPLQYFP